MMPAEQKYEYAFTVGAIGAFKVLYDAGYTLPDIKLNHLDSSFNSS